MADWMQWQLGLSKFSVIMAALGVFLHSYPEGTSQSRVNAAGLGTRRFFALNQIGSNCECLCQCKTLLVKPGVQLLAPALGLAQTNSQQSFG